MRRPVRAWLVAFACLGGELAAQISRVPYAEFSSPTFESVKLEYSYPRFYRSNASIRAVDFRSLPVRIFDEEGSPFERILLRNGTCEWADDGVHFELSLEDIYYLTPTNAAGGEYALAVFRLLSVGVSSSNQAYAQVYELRGHRLRIVQQLDWDVHFAATQYHFFDPGPKILTVRSAHYLPGDAHCCVSAMDVFTLRWTGANFEQVSMQTELSDYGRSEGKVLPGRR